MERGALTICPQLPIEIVSNFNKIQVSRKPRPRTFKRHKNRENPMRSDGVMESPKILLSDAIWCAKYRPEKEKNAEIRETGISH